MEKLTRWILPVSTAILMAGAVVTVLWTSDLEPTGHLRPRKDAYRRSLPARKGMEHATTYRFLFPSEADAVFGKLTLGRFADGRLSEGAIWVFDTVDQWHGWAPSLFEKEPGWIPEEQPGWRISRWLSETEHSPYGRSHLFWSLQALRCLDPGSFANEIDMVEGSGRTMTVLLIEGVSDYDYDTDTLYWNPVSTEPLAALAHELNHAWHDLCRDGGTVSIQERESLGLMAENRIRHILFLKDPGHAHIHPRGQPQETSSDIRDASAQHAWESYRDGAR